LRHWPVQVAGPLVAAGASALEVLRVYLLRWPLLALGFSAADTPLAQWAYFASPFFVSWILYTINFLCVPSGPRFGSLRAWTGPMTAVVWGAVFWVGGEVIARRTPLNPVPLSALLVQPNRLVGASASEPRLAALMPVAVQLRHQTQVALSEVEPLDLVVWPEGVIRRASEKLGADLASQPLVDNEEYDLEWFFRRVVVETGVPFLVGAIIQSSDNRQFNSALLVAPDGRIERYDKRLLVVGAENMYTSGNVYRNFVVHNTAGQDVLVGIRMCYEMHFPTLPQQLAANRPQVIVHLNNESMYRRYPGLHGHATWACQYRAIETRSWQFVCAAWTRSAVIDPRGGVREILGPEPGVISVSPKSYVNRPELEAVASGP
jgi:apolipoprotein N-acyltransferase